MKEWKRDTPIVIVPTKYYNTPTEHFKVVHNSTLTDDTMRVFWNLRWRSGYWCFYRDLGQPQLPRRGDCHAGNHSWNLWEAAPYGCRVWVCGVCICCLTGWLWLLQALEIKRNWKKKKKKIYPFCNRGCVFLPSWFRILVPPSPSCNPSSIATVNELFRLQNEAELREAEKVYLP